MSKLTQVVFFTNEKISQGNAFNMHVDQLAILSKHHFFIHLMVLILCVSHKSPHDAIYASYLELQDTNQLEDMNMDIFPDITTFYLKRLYKFLFPLGIYDRFGCSGSNLFRWLICNHSVLKIGFLFRWRTLKNPKCFSE